jgi:hypothetical protein
MQVPFTTTASDYTGSCARPNMLIQRICSQITTGVSDVIADSYANRPNYAASQNQSALFVATDQQVIYQSQSTGGRYQWAYVAGIMTGNATALPTLSSSDSGVLLLTQSAPYEMFRWNGSSWVNVTPGTAGSYVAGGGGAPGMALHVVAASLMPPIPSPSSSVDGQQLFVDVTQGSTAYPVPWSSGFVGVTSTSVPQTASSTTWGIFVKRISDGNWHLVAPLLTRTGG